MASPDYSDGCMIALYPPQRLADDLAVPDGLDPAEMHVTVAYLGGTADVDRDTLLAAVQALADRGPLAGSISGHARFTGGPSDVLVALVDSPDLEALRRDTVDRLGGLGVEIPRDHGYTPHLTISYIGPDAASPLERLPAVPVTFGALSAVYGDERTNFPFAPFQESLAGPRPTTEQATVQLAAPTGAWQPIYAHRLALHTTADAIVLAAWLADVRGLTLRPALAALRKQIGEAASPHQGAATAAVLAALTGHRWKRTLAALALALQRAHRAGYQAAQLLLSDGEDDGSGDDPEQYSIGSPNLTDAAASAMAARVLLAVLTATAVRASSSLLDTATRTANALQAALDRVAAGYDLGLIVDTAVSAAYGMGQQAAYLSAGTASVNWVTAGDGVVCAECQTNEDDGPYTLLAAPGLPAHPRCRCCLAPV